MLKFSLAQGRMRRPSIGARDLGKLSLDKEKQAQGGHGGLPRKGGLVCFWRRKEKEEENEVRERLLVLVCGGVHGRFMEKNEAWNGMELCVASNRGKASGLLV